MDPPLLVVGGGIGGLSAALACSRAGVPVQLFERSPAFAEVGAGIQLGALARAKLLAVAVLSIRHLVLPLVALASAYAFGLSHSQATILLAYAALPTAASCYVLASKMGFDGAYVASLVSLSTLLGMLSLPLALGVLRPLYGV